MSTTPYFTVVPLAEVPVEDAQQSSPHTQPVVLVVDDESLVADTLAIILSRAGFTTLTAYDAKSALELAHSIAPQLLISDVAMPEMNGVDLAVAMVNTVPDCKVLLFSGHATSADLVAARSAGYSFPLLAKPIHPVEMVRQVIACLKIPHMCVTVQ